MVTTVSVRKTAIEGLQRIGRRIGKRLACWFFHWRHVHYELHGPHDVDYTRHCLLCEPGTAWCGPRGF